MADSIHTQHEKVSGSSQGKHPNFKKDGYAGPGIHDSLIGTKPGLVQGSANRNTPYSGPNVAQADRGNRL